MKLEDFGPLYSPGLNWSGRFPYWKPTAKFKKAGYPPKPVRLPGVKGDNRAQERAVECRKLNAAALTLCEPVDGPRANTWAWVIAKWKADPHSRYNGCSESTRSDYDYRTGKWEDLIGGLTISALDYARIGKIITGMRSDGYSASLIQKLFGTLRLLAKYARGPLAKDSARNLVDILSDMRFESGTKREVAPTHDQIRAIIDEADARGLFGFATGLLFQWTYAFRAVDVRGQWFKDQGQGGVVRAGKRWQDGLTWDMFTTDLSAFSKVISKTKTPVTNVALTSELQARLRILRRDGGVGPVIKSDKFNLPYTKYSWSQTFRRIRDDLGISEDVKMMDTRAGALTEAKNLGADPFALRDAGQHAHVDTTDRYARDRSANIDKVVRLRSER